MSGTLLPQNDGWYRWRPDPAPSVEVLVKVVETGGGRMAISSLRVEGAVNGEVLRAIPLGRIEACANAQLGGWATPPTSGGATETRIRTSGGAAPDGTGGWETPPPGTPDEVGAVRRGRPDSFYTSIARQPARWRHRPADRPPTWPSVTRCRPPRHTAGSKKPDAGTCCARVSPARPADGPVRFSHTRGRRDGRACHAFA